MTALGDITPRALQVLACVALLSAMSWGQSGSAQLSLSLTVQSSINLIFKNNAAVGSNGFCPLTNSGTNNVGLDLGVASFPGGSDTLPCVAYAHIGGAMYQVSSAFDVVVNKANTSSPTYTLAAEISSTPPTNVTWLIASGTGAGVTLTNTKFTQLDGGDTYGAAITKTLQVQVKNTVPAQTLQETITFLATAN